MTARDISTAVKLLGLSAAIAGLLSYSGLQHFAATGAQDTTPGGVQLPWIWSWAWPLAVDVPAVALSLTVWKAQGLGQRAMSVRAAVLALVFVSTWLQVTTAPDTAAAKVAHGLPPVVLFVLWESVLWLRRLELSDLSTPADQPVVHQDKPVQPAKTKELTPQPVAAAASPHAPSVTTTVQPVPEPSPDIVLDIPKAKPRPLDAVLAAVRDLQADGIAVDKHTLADKLGQTPRNCARHLARPEVQALLGDKEPVGVQ